MHLRGILLEKDEMQRLARREAEAWALKLVYRHCPTRRRQNIVWRLSTGQQQEQAVLLFMSAEPLPSQQHKLLLYKIAALEYKRVQVV